MSVPWYACSNHILLLEVIYTAAQDQHCYSNGKTDARSIPITADQCFVDSVSEGDQSTNADSGAIEDVNEGSDTVKDLVQAGKAA